MFSSDSNSPSATAASFGAVPVDYRTAVGGTRPAGSGRAAPLALRLSACLSLCALLAACGTLGAATGETAMGAGGVAVDASESAAASPQDAALLAFVAEGAPGSRAPVDDGRGGVVQAYIEDEYVSARGRLCRRLALSGGSFGGSSSGRIACQNGEDWRLIRPLRGVAAR